MEKILKAMKVYEDELKWELQSNLISANPQHLTLLRELMAGLKEVHDLVLDQLTERGAYDVSA